MNIQGQKLDAIDIEKIVGSIFNGFQHSKRIRSIANAALGVIASTSLIIHRVGRGMAKALNLVDKHAIKQVDRLLSNKKFDVEKNQNNYVQYVIGSRKEIKIAMDWTDFDKDKQTTLSMNLITSHGRATPLLWKTFSKNKLKNNRNNYEDELLLRLRKFIPKDVKVTMLADRGFCDIKLFRFLKEDLDFDYIIRVRSNILIESNTGESSLAGDLVSDSGRTKTLRNVKITHEKYLAATFVCVKAPKMKQCWCIVSSEKELSGSGIVKWYAKRWGCEPQFRDTKDIYFGMGLSKTSIKDENRRDRLLFIHAISTVVLTLLGAAGEKIGLDRYLKANTSKKRTMSLFGQGCIYFNRLPNMVESTLNLLLGEFYSLIEQNKNLTEVLGVI